jgi:hypothetical protein
VKSHPAHVEHDSADAALDRELRPQAVCPEHGTSTTQFCTDPPACGGVGAS